jgi:hypothetical protein
MALRTTPRAVGRAARTPARAPRRPRSAPGGALPCALLYGVLLLMVGATPVSALDDGDYCVLAQQLALAAEKDIGIWIDRSTRNAGMQVSCDRRIIEYRRFTYSPSASMTDAWKARKGADWSRTHCDSAIWRDAIGRGWKIVLSETAADGASVTFTAQCL